MFVPAVVFAYELFDNTFVEKKDYFIYKDVQVSTKECEKKPCIAKNFTNEAAQKKPLLKKLGYKTNPAHELCSLLGGKPTTLFEENKNEVAVCGFNDNSSLIAWDLVNKIAK